MFDTTKTRLAAAIESAVSGPVETRRSDVWSQAGHAIELAHRQPAPASQGARTAVALAFLAAKVPWVAILR
jgi:hypothetical protein